jgi:multiple sugar transport system ATP-binding protein
MSMADRVAVLRRGALQQVGPPAEVYADPQTLFVARLLGSPRPSMLEAAVFAEDETVVLDFGSQLLKLPVGDPRTAALAERHTQRVTVGLRALPPYAGESMRLTGTVRSVENIGHELWVHVDTGAVPTPLPAAVPVAVERPRRRRQPRRRPETVPTARTEYGFYPVYDPEPSGDPPPAGEVVVRMPMPASARVGEDVNAGLSLDDLLLFDRAGRRIPLFKG